MRNSKVDKNPSHEDIYCIASVLHCNLSTVPDYLLDVYIIPNYRKGM